jgi:hypothetical protein
MASGIKPEPESASISRRDFFTQVRVTSAAVTADTLIGASGGERLSSSGEESRSVYLPDRQPLGTIEYINPTPPPFKAPAYPGEYNDALVPATLDLAERARLAIHALTSMTNPNLDYETYHLVGLMSRPPCTEIQPFDLTLWGKWVEAAALLRVISGSRENLHVDRRWMEVFLKMQGPDGLLYTPMTGRDWVLYPGFDSGSGSPGTAGYPANQFCLLSLGTARVLSAMCLFAQMDPNGPWNDAARRLAHAYDRLVINKDNDKSYFFSTWMYPGRPIEEPAHNIFDESVYLAGVQAWIAQYLVIYARAFRDPTSAKLAERIMNYNIFDRQVIESSGRFRPMGKGVVPGPLQGEYAHFHTVSTNILACLYVYRETGNKGLLDRAMKGYEYGKSKGEPLVGFFPEVVFDKPSQSPWTSETCEVADMTVAALMLAQLGYDHCWEEADRWVRNQLAEAQLTQIDWLMDGHLDYSRFQLQPDFFKSKLRSTDRVAERSLGAFAGYPSPNDWISDGNPWAGSNRENIYITIQNCCTASASRAIFAVWRDMLAYKEGNLKVNLFFNRASKWADIDSYIPYTGRVEFKIKEPLNLEVRIPEWVKPDEAKCKVDGAGRALGYQGRYAQVGEVERGQTVLVTFPISERTEKRRIQGYDFSFIVRGNDVVAVDPPGKYSPLYQRGHYRTGRPLYQKVTRFISAQDVAWW